MSFSVVRENRQKMETKKFPLIDIVADTMLILRGSEEYLQRQDLEFVLIKRTCPLCYHFAGCSELAAD